MTMLNENACICHWHLMNKGFKLRSASCIQQVPWDAVLKGVREYDPVKMAIWQEGALAPYLHVGRALQAMDSTTKRLRISDVIANMFRSLLALSPGTLQSSSLFLIDRWYTLVCWLCLLPVSPIWTRPDSSATFLRIFATFLHIFETYPYPHKKMCR